MRQEPEEDVNEPLTCTLEYETPTWGALCAQSHGDAILVPDSFPAQPSLFVPLHDAPNWNSQKWKMSAPGNQKHEVQLICRVELEDSGGAPGAQIVSSMLSP